MITLIFTTNLLHAMNYIKHIVFIILFMKILLILYLT